MSERSKTWLAKSLAHGAIPSGQAIAHLYEV